jgi:site-specific DNA-methyltransferase (adenine-specific)
MLIEKNKIYCMDCLEGMKQMKSGSVDLVVTDPPYLMQNIHEYKGNELGKHIMKYQQPLQEKNLTEGYDIRILDEIFRVMKAPNIYIWCNIAQVPMYIKYFVLEKKCRMDILIWNKTNPIPLCNNKWLSDKEYCLYFRKGAYCQPSGYAEAKTVWHLPANVKDKRAYGHPTVKPLPIIENIIRNSSREGELVLDPFMGSGTTAAASIRNSRNFIGFENNGEYYQTAMQRIRDEMFR